jgi:hypothetical protein
MSRRTIESPVPRLALRVGEAAAAFGVSEDWFSAEIAPDVPCVRRGRLKLYPVAALAAWLEEHAELLFERGAS